MNSETVEKIREALIRRAVGYDTEETVEEYSGTGEDVTMVRRKVTKKNVPPDISAAKLLLEEAGVDYSAMTDEQLEEEKRRLLELLKRADCPKRAKAEESENEQNGDGATEDDTTEKRTAKKQTQNGGQTPNGDKKSDGGQSVSAKRKAEKRKAKSEDS